MSRNLLTIHPTSGEWCPLSLLPSKYRTKDVPVYVLRTEYSKSGRARCRKCSETIPKGEVRVGFPTKYSTGEFGYISMWSHLKCSRVHDLLLDVAPADFDVDRLVHGVSALKPEDQVALRAELNSDTLPAHLQPLDPEDPVFTAKPQLTPTSTPYGVTTQLLPYQQEGLTWMINQEEGPIRGGILADEMGMGKTLQAISLIVEQRNRFISRAQASSSSNSTPKEAIRPPPTLVICPTSALLQWRDEIAQMVDIDPPLNILLFYGGQRAQATTPELIAKFDIVITTYPVLEAEYRRIANSTKVVCADCGKKMLPRKLTVHRRYFCGEGAQLSEKLKKRDRGGGASSSSSSSTNQTTATRSPSKSKRDSDDEESFDDRVTDSSSENEGNDANEDSEVTEDEADSKNASTTSGSKALAGLKVKRTLQKAMVSLGIRGRQTLNELQAEASEELRVAQEDGQETQAASPSKPTEDDPDTSLFNVTAAQSLPGMSLKRAPPTFTNIYRDYMSRSGRTPVPFHISAQVAERIQRQGEDANTGKSERGRQRKKASSLDTAQEESLVSPKEQETLIQDLTLGDDPKTSSPELWNPNANPNPASDAQPMSDVSPLKLETPKSVHAASTSMKKSPKTRRPASRRTITIEDDETPQDSDAMTSQDSPRKSPSKAKSKNSRVLVDSDEETDSDSEDDFVSTAKTTKKSTPVKSLTPTKSVRQTGKKTTQKGKSPKTKRAADDPSDSSFSESSDSDSDAGDSFTGVSTRKSSGVNAKLASGDSANRNRRTGASPRNSSLTPLTADGESIIDEDGLDVSSSPLHAVYWDRIIIDEAHKIKARVTGTARAVYALRSRTKLALSGTPLQNRVGELYALIRFLRIEPCAYYYCRVDGCECARLSWGFGSDARFCQYCNHSPMSHYSWFNCHIANPISRYGYVGQGKQGMLTLKTKVLDVAMLRRNKRDRAEDLKLPALNVRTEWVEMDKAEQDFYEAIYMQSRVKFDAYVESGTLLHNYAHIFELLARLRQAADHPYLVLYSSAVTARSATIAAITPDQQGLIETKDAQISVTTPIEVQDQPSAAETPSKKTKGKGTSTEPPKPKELTELEEYTLTRARLEEQEEEAETARRQKDDDDSTDTKKTTAKGKLRGQAKGKGKGKGKSANETPKGDDDEDNSAEDLGKKRGRGTKSKKAADVVDLDLVEEVEEDDEDDEDAQNTSKDDSALVIAEVMASSQATDDTVPTSSTAISEAETSVGPKTGVDGGAGLMAADHAMREQATVSRRRRRMCLGDVCGVCYEDIVGIPAMSRCRHTFHKECIYERIQATWRKLKEEGKDPAGKSDKTSALVMHGCECPVCFQALVLAMPLRGMEEAPGASQSGVAAHGVCVVCFDNPRDAMLYPCGHTHSCISCTKQLVSRQCPICRTTISKVIPISASMVYSGVASESGSNSQTTATPNVQGVRSVAMGRRSILQHVNLSEFAPSAKINAVSRIVKEAIEADPTNKVIIFSQYSNMIDLVEWCLRKQGILSVKFVGSQPINERRSVLQAFKTNPDVRVIIMSLKAGGEGLNLQAASHVLILEPWWNPAVESQAVQRSHRIGQTRAVTAVRFATRDTIEEKMLDLQEKKRLVFEGTVDSQASALAELSQEDLQFLFRN